MSLNTKTPNHLFSRALPFSPTTRLLRLPHPNHSLSFPISRAHSSLSSSSKPALFHLSNPNPTRRTSSNARSATDDKGSVVAEPDARIVTASKALLSCVALVFRRYETIPFSKRGHLVPVVVLGGEWENNVGRAILEKKKQTEFKDAVLPDTHPTTVRLRVILKNLIEGLEMLLERDRDDVMEEVIGKPRTVAEKVYNVFCIAKTNEKSEWPRSVLSRLEWEIVVVDDPKLSACCHFGGKIVVFTGLLDHFATDAEIATVIAHEVGYAVARHQTGYLMNYMWLQTFRITAVVKIYLSLVLLDKGYLKQLKIIWDLSIMLENHFSRKRELEADYIGLLLLASAGYDPNVAPDVYKKLCEIDGGTIVDDYISLHPSGETRAAELRKAEVMEEALCIYRDSKGKQELGVEIVEN